MKVLGTGSYIPECYVTNDDLARIVDTTNEWIVARTGIEERHISNGEENVDFAIKAARKALEDSKLEPKDIGLIIVATVTSNYITPSLACMIQNELEIPNAVAFDINAACAGFVYSLNTANCYLQSGMVKNALIIGSETLSKITDYTDRSTCVLFGDAAGAAIVSRDDSKIFNSELGADGTKNQVLYCEHSPISNCIVKNTPKTDYLHMNGHEVYKFVLREIPPLISRVVDQAGIKLEEVSCFVLHQANKRMNEKIAEKLGLSFDKFPCNLERTGNTSSASVPVLLDEIHRQGKLKRGDKVVLCSFGAGMTWGAILFEW